MIKKAFLVAILTGMAGFCGANPPEGRVVEQTVPEQGAQAELLYRSYSYNGPLKKLEKSAVTLGQPEVVFSPRVDKCLDIVHKGLLRLPDYAHWGVLFGICASINMARKVAPSYFPKREE